MVSFLLPTVEMLSLEKLYKKLCVSDEVKTSILSHMLITYYNHTNALAID